MSDTNPGLGDTSGYEIRTQGHIGEQWSAWFEGMNRIGVTAGASTPTHITREVIAAIEAISA